MDVSNSLPLIEIDIGVTWKKFQNHLSDCSCRKGIFPNPILLHCINDKKDCGHISEFINFIC